ncbi:NAD(P)/FAD-dependent oxidoreductase [Pacificoceanicola onchidii]|uniref:NAD(P)/FAD-dependent oxidoreductase n=1 Tax=Pacificoceanicola onchidii TaxID=2562685 RepID=UPI0010A3B909|nr:FAD-binding oxidoreductase [Pacificoceanicola onchidii]
MKTDVQVAVIGGGIVGASVLYWLAKMGWTDSVLLERRELTSGSTWHAAGNTTYFGPYPKMTALFAGSIRTYLQAEAESGQSVGFHQTGSLRLAATERELALFHAYAPRYAQLGIPFHIRSPEAVAELHPFLDTTAIYGAAHTPTDGHVDPTGATNALAQAARQHGALIERHCPVKALVREAGKWVLDTPKGKVTAGHVVVATSFWAREMLEPLGLRLPLYPTQHHEIITQALPQIAALDRELPAMRDSWVSCNVRQERDGLLIGIYEKAPEFWALDGIPPDFKEELLPPNMDPLMPHLERLMTRMPLFAQAGIKVVNNGPMCLTPDGLPLIGPVPDREGLWLAAGFNVGIGTGGGSAEILARWMTTGQPPQGLSAIHADRFGKGMDRAAALAAIRDVYARGYELPDAI